MNLEGSEGIDDVAEMLSAGDGGEIRMGIALERGEAKCAEIRLGGFGEKAENAVEHFSGGFAGEGGGEEGLGLFTLGKERDEAHGEAISFAGAGRGADDLMNLG